MVNNFLRQLNVTYMRRCSDKANKLRYVYTLRGTLRDNAIKEREINECKIYPVYHILFCRNCTINNRRVHVKIAASVSEAFPLFS